MKDEIEKIINEYTQHVLYCVSKMINGGMSREEEIAGETKAITAILELFNKQLQAQKTELIEKVENHNFVNTKDVREHILNDGEIYIQEKALQSLIKSLKGE